MKKFNESSSSQIIIDYHPSLLDNFTFIVDTLIPIRDNNINMRFSWFRNLTAIGIRVVGLISKFLLVICLVQYFQPSELGLYGVLTAVLAYILFFLGLEFYNYTSRALVGASNEEQSLIIKEQFTLYTITFILLSPLFYILIYMDILSNTLGIWFFLLVLFEHVSNELMRILIALAHPYLANLIFFIRQGLWIFVLLPIFYFFPSSRHFNILFIAWVIGAAFSCIIGFIPLAYLPWRNVWNQPIRWSIIWQGLLISRPFILSAFCALSLLYIERFFVSYYCGLEAAGIYTFYAGLSLTLHNLVNTGVAKMRLAQLLAAWKQNNKIEFYNEAMHMLKYTAIFVFVFSTFSIILIVPFVTLLNKAIYLNNLPIFYFLLCGAACRSIADVPLYTLYAQHRDKLILLINFTSFFIIIVGNIILVPRIGFIGAAISSTIASFVLLSFSMTIMIQRTIKPLPLLQS